MGVVGSESGKRAMWCALDWEWSRILGMVEDTGNGPGCGTGGRGRLANAKQGKHRSSNRIFPQGLKSSLWVCRNNFKPGFAWSRGKSVPAV